MAIEEVVDWGTEPRDNRASHPTSPEGIRADRISFSFQELQAAIARWRDTLGGGGGIGGSIADNQVAVGAATANEIEGSTNVTWDGTEFRILGALSITAGSSVGAGFYFNNDPDCGIYRQANNTIAIAAGGTQFLTIGSTNVQISHTSGVTARTIAAASGGLEVNNTVTGAGFERALTTSDLGASIPGRWQYDNTTTAADPGSGNFRLNNTTIALATALYIADETKGGTDFSNVLNGLGAGDRIYLQNGEDATESLLLTVATVTDNTGWFTITFTVDDTGTATTWTDGKEFAFILGIGASGGGGGIGGSIAENQIAIGAVTANEIEGLAEFTYNASTITFGSNAVKLIGSVATGLRVQSNTANAHTLGLLNSAGGIEGSVFAQDSNIYLLAGNSETVLRGDANGNLRLHFNNIEKFYTTSNGVAIASGQRMNFDGLVGTGDTYITSPATPANRLDFVTGGSNALLLESSAATFNGIGIFPPSTSALASIRLPHGAVPVSPTNGDIWTTTGGVFARVNGVTNQLDAAGGGGISGTIASGQVAYGTGADTIGGSSRLQWADTTRTLTVGDSADSAEILINGSITGNPSLQLQQNGTTVGRFQFADVFNCVDIGGATSTQISFSPGGLSAFGGGGINSSGKLFTKASTTATSGFRIPPGQTPVTVLQDGDIWTTTSGIFARINGTTNQLDASGGGRTYLATAASVGTGTTLSITGIPSTARKVVVIFEGVSHNALSARRLGLYLGDSGGIETAGYSGTTENFTGTNVNWVGVGRALASGGARTNSVPINVRWTLEYFSTANRWSIQVSEHGTSAGSDSSAGHGFKTLTGALSQLQFNWFVDGSFDAGTYTAYYEE